VTTTLNAAGGEPFLHPHIFELIAAAKEAGLVTSVVTNGSCLDAAKLLKLQVSPLMGHPQHSQAMHGGRAACGLQLWQLLFAVGCVCCCGSMSVCFLR
jgi:organic radical activating enzyme